jgi:hypothetical protein
MFKLKAQSQHMERTMDKEDQPFQPHLVDREEGTMTERIVIIGIALLVTWVFGPGENTGVVLSLSQRLLAFFTL